MKKKCQNLYLKTFSFFVVKFPIHLNRRVFVTVMRLRKMTPLWTGLCFRMGLIGDDSDKVESEYHFYWYYQPTKIFDINIFYIAIYSAYNLVPDFNHRK